MPPSERNPMRLTIDLDTSELTAEDRRVLMALAGHDTTGELRITRLTPEDVERMTGGDASPATPSTPPLPVPVPAGFAARLGEAVQQFGPRGTGPDARLPVAQQAGVRTSSTMPDDDEPAEVVDASEFETQIMDAVQTPLSDGPLAHPHAPDVDGPQVIRARGGMAVPRDLIEDDGPPHRIEDATRDAILGVVEQPPVRHTSP